MPIHDPATLEKFRQAATACRTSRRTKSRTVSGATVAAAAATGNGGVGRYVGGGPESAALVPLSPSPLGRQATSPTTAETRFFPPYAADSNAAAVDAADDETADDYESRRRTRGRRRTLAVVTSARWLHQLLPSRSAAGSQATATAAGAASRSGQRQPPSPPPSDDDSAASDVEINLLRRTYNRRDIAEVRERREGSPSAAGDDGDQRRSRDTFYSSTATDRFRLSTGSDSASVRMMSFSGDERYSPDVFQSVGASSDASESCSTVIDQAGQRRTSSNTDEIHPAVTAPPNNDLSAADADDVNRTFDAASSIESSLLMANTRPSLRFELLQCTMQSIETRLKPNSISRSETWSKSWSQTCGTCASGSQTSRKHVVNPF